MYLSPSKFTKVLLGFCFKAIVFLLQICQKRSRGTGLPCVKDFQEAFTLTGAGEQFDLERFEILGDAFLKFSVSLSLFLNQSIRLKNEGCLTQYRSMLVGNKNLLNCARSKNFDRVLSARRFEPHLCWQAPRLKQTQNAETILCSWDDEFRESFYAGEKDDEEKVCLILKLKLFIFTLII